MFCRKCYANLDQASGSRCARCGRRFDPDRPRSYLRRPFPSRLRILLHTLVTLLLATGISFVVASFLALAQLKYINSGH
jgi:predicted amidophosphoribosyltransferase